MKRVKQPHGGTLSIPEKGDRFNPFGRPPKLFSQLAKDFKQRGIERATPERVAEVYENLLALTLEEIRAIAGKFGNDETVTIEDETDQAERLADNNDYPAIMRMAAAEMLGKRRQEILREMLDRAHGKSKQSLDLNVKSATLEDGEFLPEQLEGLKSIIKGNGNSDTGTNQVSSGKRSSGAT